MNCHPVASAYQAADERIIEFSSAQGGGLISISTNEADGTVTVLVYRQDASVRVREGERQ